MAAAAAALARLAVAFLLLVAQAACEYGMVHVVSETGGPEGKDYCILYNPQWAHLPHDLGKASLLQLRDWTASMLCSPLDVPTRGFSNQIPLVARGNCTFYEKVRLAQGGGARGLLIVSKEALVPPGGNKTQYDEIGIPVALLSHKDMLDIFKSFGRAVRAALYAPNEPMLDYNMVIIFVMAVGTVALGGYWAGSRDVKKRYMKHKRDDGPEKQEDEAVDVTPVMICVFVVMCCSMLVLLYHFYDQLVYVIIGIFCLSSSTGLYSCLSPLVQRLPFGRCRVPDNSLPYFHKRPPVSLLLLALLCLAVSVVWGVFRNEDQWAWILQDALGVAFCLYMLKTIRLPTFKVRARGRGASGWVRRDGGVLRASVPTADLERPQACPHPPVLGRPWPSVGSVVFGPRPSCRLPSDRTPGPAAAPASRCDSRGGDHRAMRTPGTLPRAGLQAGAPPGVAAVPGGACSGRRRTYGQASVVGGLARGPGPSSPRGSTWHAVRKARHPTPSVTNHTAISLNLTPPGFSVPQKPCLPDLVVPGTGLGLLRRSPRGFVPGALLSLAVEGGASGGGGGRASRGSVRPPPRRAPIRTSPPGLHAAAAGAVCLRRLLRVRHALPDQEREQHHGGGGHWALGLGHPREAPHGPEGAQTERLATGPV
ncbi:signal peptide peptidase-like 2B isoform X1 [Mustela erminea]|uniref:signal peptide peptidase-like 2B isoform X1 n=1 Tax=Mustela erminea TaxID=36723 RepID=UPI001386B748|nr:signal peptide peptidase-like 2B isoform X1 [Mustela erminea]